MDGSVIVDTDVILPFGASNAKLRCHVSENASTLRKISVRISRQLNAWVQTFNELDSNDSLDRQQHSSA